MSKYVRIGFDPDQTDPATEPNMQAATSGGRDEAAPRQTGGLDQATPSEFGAAGGLKPEIADAIKNLVARHRTPEWRL
jgi:hypothetical protein